MPATVAPMDDAEAGVFEAIVSVFNNKDLVGDIVRPGAFTKSIEAWKASGDPIPVYWSHRLDDPTFNIGEVIEAKELTGGDPTIPPWANAHVKANGGLYIKGRLDEHGLGAQVRHLLKTRRVKQFSFSYDVEREQHSKSEDANDLLDLWLHEIGPTPLGANPMTVLIGAKSDPPVEAPPETPTTRASLPTAADLRRRCETAVLRHAYAD